MGVKLSHYFIGIISLFLLTGQSWARDIEYKGSEVAVSVVPGEPTQIQFPGTIKGGYKKQVSSLHLDKKDSDLIIFAKESLNESGEAIIVRTEDGRSYSIRVRLAAEGEPRDDVVKVEDADSGDYDEEEETPEYKEQKFEYAPPSTVSGFLREMILAAEFGKSKIQGYRVSNRYKGEAVLHDGTMRATIDKIFIGPSLWGYVIDAENLLDQTQKINPASFRIDGVRAISSQHWELAPRPLTIEQEVARKDKTKIYVVTRAKKNR